MPAAENTKGKKKSTVDQVWDMAAPLADELGLKIWDIHFLKDGAEWFFAHIY